MKQALTSAGERSVWYKCAQDALTASGVTVSVEREPMTLAGDHPQYGFISVSFTVPESGKTRMEVTVDAPELYEMFKREVGMAFIRSDKSETLAKLMAQKRREKMDAASQPQTTEAKAPKEAPKETSEEAPKEETPKEASPKGFKLTDLLPGTVCKKCGAEMDKDTRICPQCGAKRLTANMLIIGIVGVVLLIALVCMAVFSMKSKESPAPVEEPAAPEQTEVITVVEENLPTEEGAVSLEMYDKVLDGLEYKEVCGLFGEEGILLQEMAYADDDGSNAQLQVYYWAGKGEENANATIMFKDGIVVSKSQFGLN